VFMLDSRRSAGGTQADYLKSAVERGCSGQDPAGLGTGGVRCLADRADSFPRVATLSDDSSSLLYFGIQSATLSDCFAGAILHAVSPSRPGRHFIVRAMKQYGRPAADDLHVLGSSSTGSTIVLATEGRAVSRRLGVSA